MLFRGSLGPIDQFGSVSDDDKLSPLPESWAYVKLGHVIGDPKYGTAKKCGYELSGSGVLRIPNIVSGTIDDSDLKFATFDDAEIESYELRKGDLLVIRSNGSVSIVGRSAVVSEREEKYLYAGYLIRIRPRTDIIDPEYLHIVLQSHALRNQIERKAKSTSGVNNINSGELQSLTIPFCSIDEQRMLVKLIQEKLSLTSAMEADVERELRRADVLRQAVLNRAFTGNLARRDSSDEPASALIERIKEEIESASSKVKLARRRVA